MSISRVELEFERSFTEELDEIAIHIPNAKCTQSQVVQLGDVEVNHDSSLLQLSENIVTVMDRESCLEYPINLEWVLDAGNSFHQRPRFRILDEFENVVAILKQREAEIFSHLALFYQMESKFVLIPAGSYRGIRRRQSYK
jgi:hypothetical protein